MSEFADAIMHFHIPLLKKERKKERINYSVLILWIFVYFQTPYLREREYSFICPTSLHNRDIVTLHIYLFLLILIFRDIL